MPFFIRNGTHRNDGKTTNNQKRKLPMPKSHKRNSANEDIPSDDDSSNDEMDKYVASRSDEEEYEDVQETAYRKAKQLLADVQGEEQIEGESYDNEAIAHRLRDDALSKIANLHKPVADSLRTAIVAISYRAHRYAVIDIAISHDDQYIVSCSKDSILVKYDIKEGRKVAEVQYRKGDDKCHQGHILCVAISANDRYVVTGGSDSIIRVWKFENLEHLKNLSGHRNAVTGLVFRLNTQQLYSCSKDRTVKLWDLEQMGYVDTLFGHTDAIIDIDALSRERVVTAGAQDRTVRLWKIPEESHLIFNGYSSCFSIDCVALINEDHFVSGSVDGSLSVWSVFKKKPVCTVNAAHGYNNNNIPNWIVSVAALRYTDLIASGSSDGIIRLWKVAEDYKSLTNFLSYRQFGIINRMRFSNQGNKLICAVGKDHKFGSWWKVDEARNAISVYLFKFTNEAK